MRDKVVVPAVMLAGTALIVGFTLMAARGEPQAEGSLDSAVLSTLESAQAPAAAEVPATETPSVAIDIPAQETTVPDSVPADPATTPVAMDAPVVGVAEPQIPVEQSESAIQLTSDAPDAQPAADIQPAADATATPATQPDLPPVEETTEALTNGTVTLTPTQEPEPQLPAGMNLTVQPDSRITINLEDTPLPEVVKLFTRIVDANIMYSATNLRGNVSVHLKDVEWRPALEAILGQQGLTLSDSGSGVYNIVPKAEGAPEPLLAETIFLKYAKVNDVKQAVKDSLDARGKLAEFISRNALVIRTTRVNMAEITNIIGMIDVPRGQVYIEAKFMELSDSAIRTLGINWQMFQAYQVGGSASLLNQQESISKTASDSGTLDKGDTRSASDAMQGSYDVESDGLVPQEAATRTVSDSLSRNAGATKTLSETASRDFSDVRTAILSPLSFNLILSALKQESGVSVVSNPRILVANSEPATISIGERRTPLVPRTSSIEGSLRTTYEPGAVVESGVKLTVTPTINTESNITVEIQPEITRILSQGEWTTAPDGSKYPAVANKTITTIFSLLSGETAAIGGLTETTDQEVGTKIPILGDIPLIGKYLFSHKTKEKTQKETIIFVTVGLVSPDRLEENVGMPQGAELVHKRILIDTEQHRQFQQQLDALQDASKNREEKSVRKRQFLHDRAR